MDQAGTERDAQRCPFHAPDTLDERIREWSSFQPWTQENTVSYWKEMRDHAPIVRSEEAGGYWILTRYEDIEWAARNPEYFSNAELGIPHREIFEQKQIPIQLDGEEHRQWRQALSTVFNPNMVNHFTPQIREAAIDAIEPIRQKGRCEFISEFAVALPAETFLITFGIGREHLQGLLDHRDWLRNVGIPSAKNDEEIFAASRPMWEFFSDAIERRRSEGIEGRRDVMSQLLRSTYAGRELTMAELVNVTFMTMLASLDTTTSALGLAFEHLAANPETQALVASSPDKLPAIVEELIRHEPLAATGRVVVKDVERHGITLRKGDRVLMSWGMSGLDPDAFERPDEVDFERNSTRQLAFGIGPHRCLGMHLARRIISVAMQEWHARIPRYHIAEGSQPKHFYRPNRGLVSLDLVAD